MSRLGVDVSGHQTLEQVTAAAASVDNGFVIVKATEGEGLDIVRYPGHIQAVRAAGKLAGAFHFAWPNQNPVTEAAHFVRYAALRPGELSALDLEPWGELDPTKPNYARDKAMRDATPWTQRVTYALTWLAEVKRLTGATPLVYVNWNWIKGMRTAATTEQWAQLTAFPCWLADWSLVAGQHSTINGQGGTAEGGWPIAMHQYGVIGGLDRDYTPDIEALRRLAKP